MYDSKKNTLTSIFYKLILPTTDSDFRCFIEEVNNLLDKHPKIIAKIEEDLNFNAHTKKNLRFADKKIIEYMTLLLPNFTVDEVEQK